MNFPPPIFPLTWSFPGSQQWPEPMEWQQTNPFQASETNPAWRPSWTPFESPPTSAWVPPTSFPQFQGPNQNVVPLQAIPFQCHPFWPGWGYCFMTETGQLVQVDQVPRAAFPTFSAPPPGHASPAAIDYLATRGLEYNPNAFPRAPNLAEIFVPAQDPIKELKKEPERFVLVDVEALTKILRKSSSADTLRNVTETEREKYQKRAHSGLEGQRWNTVWDFAERENDRRRDPTWLSRSDLNLHRNRILPMQSASYEKFPKRSSIWESTFAAARPPSRELNPVATRPWFRPSLFEYKSASEGQPVERRCSRSSHDIRSSWTSPKHSGPPRTNNGNGSALDFFGSSNRFQNSSASHQPQLVGNLPYRFPSNTTLSLYPDARKRPRSSEARLFRDESPRMMREDNDIFRVMRKFGPRDLSVQINPIELEELPRRSVWDSLWRFVQSDQSTSPVKRTPSGNFDANVTLTRTDYFCEPHWRQLNRMTTSSGQCFVAKFVIGHLLWGEIVYEQTFDVSGLNLDKLVEFGQAHVRVYPSGCGTDVPPVGQGLNRPATVILRRVFPTNPITKRAVTDTGKIRHLNFTETLRGRAESYGGTFVCYEAAGGVWTFKVPYMVPNSIRPYYSTLSQN